MKKLFLILAIMISAIGLQNNSYAQNINADTCKVYPVPPGYTFSNSDSLTWFAIDRPRLERMLLKAELFDSTFSLLKRENEINERLKESVYTWRIIACGSATFVIAVVIWESIR